MLFGKYPSLCPCDASDVLVFSSLSEADGNGVTTRGGSDLAYRFCSHGCSSRQSRLEKQRTLWNAVFVEESVTVRRAVAGQ